MKNPEKSHKFLKKEIFLKYAYQNVCMISELLIRTNYKYLGFLLLGT